MRLIPPSWPVLKAVLFLIFLPCHAEESVSLSQGGPSLPIEIRHVRTLENPLPGSNGNCHLLPGTAGEEPRFAVSLATSYDNCTVVFYNAQLEKVATWREPIAGGEKGMVITSGDLDGDGGVEIVLSVRKKAAGAYALQWNERTDEMDTIWSFTDVHEAPFYRGIEVGNFTADEGKEVCLGADDGGLYLLDKDGKFLARRNLKGATIQSIDVCDHDGDGLDEMIVATGRNPGQVHYVRWVPETLELDVAWSANVTPDYRRGDDYDGPVFYHDGTPTRRGGNNSYEALYHPNGHPDGGGAIAVGTEQESPRYARAGSVLLLDMEGRELWHYTYPPAEERGGACGFADITGDGRPEILSRYERKLTGTQEVGILIFDNRGCVLARIPGVTASSAGPYVFRPNGDGTHPIYVLATRNVYEVVE